MATTMRLIGKVVLGSDTATITFSDIPGSGYTDLLLSMSLRTSASGSNNDCAMKFNGSTTGRSYRSLYGTGSSTGSSNGSTLLYIGPASATTSASNTFSSFEIYIPNYAGSANKSFSCTTANEDNASLAYIFAIAGLWSNTDAITSIDVYSNTSANFKSGSSAFLYGITKA